MFYYFSTGIGPRRGLIGPTFLSLGYTGIKGKPRLEALSGLHPVFPQCGPYEALERTYPVGNTFIHSMFNAWLNDEAHALSPPLFAEMDRQAY